MIRNPLRVNAADIMRRCLAILASALHEVVYYHVSAEYPFNVNSKKGPTKIQSKEKFKGCRSCRDLLCLLRYCRDYCNRENCDSPLFPDITKKRVKRIRENRNKTMHGTLLKDENHSSVPAQIDELELFLRDLYTSCAKRRCRDSEKAINSALKSLVDEKAECALVCGKIEPITEQMFEKDLNQRIEIAQVTIQHLRMMVNDEDLSQKATAFVLSTLTSRLLKKSPHGFIQREDMEESDIYELSVKLP
eukprot:CAMPEP_0206195016 /NCGR_PEP_ID=MMETSP0166-20121206/7566_1 /ASSEMBLY_ACC=CAM_ASM_000260 /TAXON_ID=95228 /ORGANISM="Vannella robusta, Strain DIVA3 518/3/11/1/6" /LENGTH=247 /DNA_ID=CAMNT_0053612149 /DNA_START=15 /DNA_END=754 /DNA_ORIENTATION=-